MSNSINKTATAGGIFQIILTPVLIVVFGTLFSLLTGYKANNHVIMIRILVWMGNLITSWVVSTAVLKVFLEEKYPLTRISICFSHTLFQS